MREKERLPASWNAKLEQLKNRFVRGNKSGRDYLLANIKAVQQAVSGGGPDRHDEDPRAGVRVVVNLSSVHVPAFCEAEKKGDPKPYKNAYDIEKMACNEGNPAPLSERRRLVDAALPLPLGQSPSETYFGTVELNGSGIRFYGDVCLVLKVDSIGPNTVVLDRNSYDVIRSPAIERVNSLPKAQQSNERSAVLRQWSGFFRRDIGTIVAIKTISTYGAIQRRLTTGQISEAARDDEDYIEVLRLGTFAPSDVQEARIASDEAAHDALVSARFPIKPAPRLEQLIWRDRREHAERALRARGVRVKIVTSSGRTRG